MKSEGCRKNVLNVELLIKIQAVGEMKKKKYIQKATIFFHVLPDPWEGSSAPDMDTSMNTVRMVNYQ